MQIDFTEGRLAVKLDPSGQLLSTFIALINRVLGQFSEEERKRIGIHTCPGGDRDSTHSADVDYAGLLPSLFSVDVGNFYMQLASEPDRRRVLRIVRENLHPPRRVFVGVIDPINPKVETPQEVRDRVLEASEFIPPALLGTTDDCGFSPFGDDFSTARETAFAKIRSRIEGTLLAAASRSVASIRSVFRHYAKPRILAGDREVCLIKHRSDKNLGSTAPDWWRRLSYGIVNHLRSFALSRNTRRKQRRPIFSVRKIRNACGGSLASTGRPWKNSWREKGRPQITNLGEGARCVAPTLSKLLRCSYARKATPPVTKGQSC